MAKAPALPLQLDTITTLAVKKCVKDGAYDLARAKVNSTQPSVHKINVKVGIDGILTIGADTPAGGETSVEGEFNAYELLAIALRMAKLEPADVAQECAKVLKKESLANEAHLLKVEMELYKDLLPTQRAQVAAFRRGSVSFAGVVK